MVAVAFQLIVRWCWTISCERFFKACRRSQNYDVILGYSKTNQRTSCITYIHNIYLQWYIYNKTRIIFSIILMKQTTATFLVKASSLNLISRFHPPHQRHPHPLSTNQRLPKFSPSLRRPSWFKIPRQHSTAVQQQLPQEQLQQQRRRQQQRQQQQIKHLYIGVIRSNSLAAAWCISNATPVAKCMCNRYLRSPGSVPTSHAAITDLCPLPFRP